MSTKTEKPAEKKTAEAEHKAEQKAVASAEQLFDNIIDQLNEWRAKPGVRGMVVDKVNTVIFGLREAKVSVSEILSTPIPEPEEEATTEQK